MVSLKVQIQIEKNGDIIHRFRNFGEDVWRQLGDQVDINLDEIDSSTSSFFIHNMKTKKVKRTIRLIEDLLLQHNLHISGEVTIADPLENPLEPC